MMIDVEVGKRLVEAGIMTREERDAMMTEKAASEPKAPTLPTPRLWMITYADDPAELVLLTMSQDVVENARELPCVAEVVSQWDKAGTYTMRLNPLYVADTEMTRQTRAWILYEMERLFPSSGLVATTDDPNGLALEDYSDDFDDDDFGDEPDGVGGHV